MIERFKEHWKENKWKYVGLAIGLEFALQIILAVLAGPVVGLVTMGVANAIGYGFLVVPAAITALAARSAIKDRQKDRGLQEEIAKKREIRRQRKLQRQQRRGQSYAQTQTIKRTPSIVNNETITATASANKEVKPDPTPAPVKSAEPNVLEQTVRNDEMTSNIPSVITLGEQLDEVSEVSKAQSFEKTVRSDEMISNIPSIDVPSTGVEEIEKTFEPEIENNATIDNSYDPAQVQRSAWYVRSALHKCYNGVTLDIVDRDSIESYFNIVSSGTPYGEALESCMSQPERDALEAVAYDLGIEKSNQNRGR